MHVDPPPYEPPSLFLSLTPDQQTNKLLITLTPPAAPPNVTHTRAPLDICCAIDVSGSMGTEAPAPGDAGSRENPELSVLDIVRHSLKTIITTMKDADRIAHVTFSDRAKVVAELTKMTADNKKLLLDKITALRTISSTNLWDGLKTGMNLLHESAPADVSSSNRLSTLFILTDGMPNVEPPRGHIPMLKSYLDSHSDSTLKFSINTFGFGYDLDSELLHEIAQVGGGNYGFIPDSGMVGTVFVHAVANAYGTWATRVRVDLEFEGEGLDDVEVMGGIRSTRTSWGIQLDAGDVQFAQTRYFVLSFPIDKWPKLISASATLNPYTNDSSSPIEAISHRSHSLMARRMNKVSRRLDTTLPDFPSYLLYSLQIALVLPPISTSRVRSSQPYSLTSHPIRCFRHMPQRKHCPKIYQAKVFWLSKRIILNVGDDILIRNNSASISKTRVSKSMVQ